MKKKIIIFGGFLLVVLFTTVFLILGKPKMIPLIVVSTIPENKAQFVNEKNEVVITLNRNVDPKESGVLKIEIAPDIPVQKVYLENKIRISPEPSFELATDYQIKVFYKEKVIYILNFWTNPFTPEQIKEEGAKQTQGDIDFAEAYKKFLEKYPWYTRLPIDTYEYRIVYDFEQEKFRIRLKLKIPNEQRQNVVDKALNDLGKIGVAKPIKYYIIEAE